MAAFGGKGQRRRRTKRQPENIVKKFTEIKNREETEPKAKPERYCNNNCKTVEQQQQNQRYEKIKRQGKQQICMSRCMVVPCHH